MYFVYIFLIIFKQKIDMKNRRYFLKTACKPIVLATLGIPIIEACSTEEDSTVTAPTNSTPTDNSSSQASSSNELEIDLDDNRFSSLQEIGGWLNFTSENILLICTYSIDLDFELIYASQSNPTILALYLN